MAWSAGAKIAQQAVQFGLSVLLMRLLGPRAFGVIGMVLVFTGFAGVFSDMGFSSALIQCQNVTERHKSTVFWLTVASGGALSALVALTSPLIAGFYHQPSLAPLAACVGLTFIAAAPGAVPRSLLQRSMRFDRLAIIDIAAVATSAAVAVSFALAGGGVWSLVAQGLTSAALGSALAFSLVSWRPAFLFSRAALRDLARYGAGLTGFNVINYWARSADNLLVGRFMGPLALGIYSRAYGLMLLPLTHVIGVLSPAVFPALASIQEQKHRVRLAYLRAVRLVSFVAFPLMVGLIAVARPFVLGLLGPQWAGVIPLLQILPIVGMTQTLNNPVGWIYTCQGRTDWMFWWGIIASSTLILGIVIGIAVGTLQAVALGYLAANVILLVPAIAIPGRLIDMKVREVFRYNAGNFACAAMMGAALWSLQLLLSGSVRPLIALSVLLPIGVVTYTGLASACRLGAMHDLLLVARAVRPALYARLCWLDRGVEGVGEAA